MTKIRFEKSIDEKNSWTATLRPDWWSAMTDYQFTKENFEALEKIIKETFATATVEFMPWDTHIVYIRLKNDADAAFFEVWSSDGVEV